MAFGIIQQNKLARHMHLSTYRVSLSQLYSNRAFTLVAFAKVQRGYKFWAPFPNVTQPCTMRATIAPGLPLALRQRLRGDGY